MNAGTPILIVGKAYRFTGIAYIFDVSAVDVTKPLVETALDTEFCQIFPILKGHSHGDGTIFLGEDHRLALHCGYVPPEHLDRDRCGHVLTPRVLILGGLGPSHTGNPKNSKLLVTCAP